MKFLRSRQVARAADPSPAHADRRGLVVGAGIVGVAAVAAAVLHRHAVAVPEVAGDAVAPAAGGDGYQVTPHVLRYYETTRS